MTIEPPAAAPSPLQAEIQAKTTAAVQDTGLGKDFDMEVEAAIAKDAGQPAPKIVQPEPPKPAPKPRETAPEPKGLDIPEALLGERKKPEAKEPAAVEAERQREIEENIKGMSPKAADRFKALEAKKHEAEQRASKASELERELSEVRAKLAAQSTNPELEALKKQNEELDAIVQRTNITEHPKFKNHYDAQIEKEIGTASKLVKDGAVDEVKALLSLPETAQRNRRLNEISQELEPLELVKFNAAVERADRLASERSHELTNWKVNKQRLAEMTQVEQAQTQEQRQRVIDSAVKAVETRFSDDEKGIELFRRVDGNDEWNQKVEGRLAQVRKLTAAELKPNDIAEMAAWAMAGSEYRHLFLSQRTLVKKLQQEIQSMKGGAPSMGEGVASEQEADENGSMVDILARVAQKAGAVR